MMLACATANMFRGDSRERCSLSSRNTYESLVLLRMFEMPSEYLPTALTTVPLQTRVTFVLQHAPVLQSEIVGVKTAD
jgi:hypothetical protein